MSSDLTKVAEALGLFASAIKCGEPWTETCERVHREAQEAMKRLATESAPAQPDESGVIPGKREIYEGKLREVKNPDRVGWWRFNDHYDRDGYCDNPARGY